MFGSMTASACVAAAIIALAGCGGGSTSSTGAAAPGGPPLSRQDFVRQANAACQEARRNFAALQPPSSASDLPAVAKLAGQQVNIAAETFPTMARLTPPKDLQAKYAQYLSDSQIEISTASNLQSAAEAGDASQAQAYERLLKAESENTDAEARALGLDECASNAGPHG